MARFHYVGREGHGKLVRDKIAANCLREGHGVKTRQLKTDELAAEIIAKMPEEVEELKVALAGGDPDEEKTEIADVLTLIDSYIKARGLDRAEIEQIVDKKAAKAGAFQDGVFIEYVDLNSDGDDYDFWLNYFRSNPDKYIEEQE